MTKFWQVPPGAIAVCEIYEFFEHSGICTGEQQIVELHGTGLVRLVGAQRFLAARSGDAIEIFVDRFGQIIRNEQTSDRALRMVYQHLPYDVLHLNCHKFTYYCVTGVWLPITSFYDLKLALAEHFCTELRVKRVRS